MTTDTVTRVLTFEEWFPSEPSIMPEHLRVAAEMGWHARDAEIAELKRQLAEIGEHERLAVTAAEEATLSRFGHSIAYDGPTMSAGENLYYEGWNAFRQKMFNLRDHGALDAYVQERVAEARLDEAEWWAFPPNTFNEWHYKERLGRLRAAVVRPTSERKAT